MGRKPAGLTKNHGSVLQGAFLAAYAQTGNITAAARLAGCDPSNHRINWVKDPAYLARFQEAHEQACDMLEAEAIRRATRGTPRNIYHKDKRIDTVMEYSDSLLIQLLKANRPAKFRENMHVTADHTVKAYGREAPIEKV